MNDGGVVGGGLGLGEAGGYLEMGGGGVASLGKMVGWEGEAIGDGERSGQRGPGRPRSDRAGGGGGEVEAIGDGERSGRKLGRGERGDGLRSGME